ncbi:HugZ family protein [Polaromonas jejuensis]|uniref:HugZ family protein n=1 Tax=Polaromonas jejuensis TaxID=457502 RepID=A0ABW0QEF2_9BURK|nr:pyridoxamine 5'-phosphate oxidase family protein [Polaromonas jejuensis]
MPHESGLTRELRSLLHTQRVAAMGTTSDAGSAFVSMVPYAIVVALEPALACLVIHVSGLAVHTRNLQARAQVSLLVMRPEVPGEPVHALPRVTLEGLAEVLEPGSPAWRACRAAYLQRFPEAEPMTGLGDFMFVAVHAKGARQVAGFGAARSLDADEVRLALAPAPAGQD